MVGIDHTPVNKRYGFVRQLSHSTVHQVHVPCTLLLRISATMMCREKAILLRGAFYGTTDVVYLHTTNPNYTGHCQAISKL